MKPILIGAIVTIAVLLAAVYFTPDGTEAPSSSGPAPTKSESFNLN